MALARNPEYVEALIHRGLVLADLGRGEEAEGVRPGSGGAREGGEFRVVAGRLANLHAQLGEAYAEAGAPHEAASEVSARS